MKFVQIVPFYPLPLPMHEPEDYFLMPADIMKEKGFECEYVTRRAQGARMVETRYAKDAAAEDEFKGYRIKRFDSYRSVLSYARTADVVQAHLRAFPPSTFIAFSRVPKVIRPFTYVMGSNLPIKFLTAVALRRFDRVLAVTPYEMSVYQKWKVPEKKLQLLPLSIDYALFSNTKERAGVREEYGIRKDDKVIIAVANVRKHKRYDVLVKAFTRVQKKFPNARVIVVGDDWSESQNFLSVTQLAKKYGVEDRVMITGFKTPQQVRDLYAVSDVFVHTAENEYQGLVSYEAAANGLPLCLSAIGSQTSVFKQDALYHEVEDDLALAENILQSLRHPEKRQTHVDYLRTHMKQWDYPVIRKQMSAMYDGVIA